MNGPDGEEVLIDLSSDTVTPENLDEGVTAHDASGEQIVGARKNLTAGKVLVSDADGKVSASTTDANEVTYFYGSSDEVNAALENLEVGTNIYCENDTEFDQGYNITEDRAVITNADGELSPSDVTAQELGYLSGLTGNVQDSIDSLSAEEDIEIVAGNNIGGVINYCYVKNDILYLNAQAEVVGNLARYQAIITFSGYKATRTAISIGGTPDGKVAQIYCERNTNKILINTINGIVANDWILMNFCIPVTKI